MAKPLPKIVCFFDKECECKKKNNNNGCGFDGTCNQKAKPYLINGKLVYLRRSDFVRLTEMVKYRELEEVKTE